jgi:cytochrome c2
MRRLVIAFAVSLLAGPAAAGDGREAFEADCAGCHALEGPSTPAGPSLKGVMWSDIASRKDFTYSTALKAVVGVWSPERLDAFLRDTRAFAPGTDMLYDVPDAGERRAIVSYLKGLK